MQATRDQVVAEFNAAAGRQKPSLAEMFTDVYDEKLPHLAEQVCSLHALVLTGQEQQMLAHIAKYPESFDLSHHARSN